MAVRNILVIPAKPMQKLKGLEVTAKPRVCTIAVFPRTMRAVIKLRGAGRDRSLSQ